MDKSSKQNRWHWMREAMPGVASIVARKRAEWGNAHVNLCIKKGLEEQLPGYFFAAEGPLAVGVPWAGFGEDWLKRDIKSAVLVVMRDPGATDAQG